jgi:DNA-binding transcriptional ArsR family regulator
MTFSKTEIFDENSREIARIAKALSHPARIAILKYLARLNVCISGDITSEIPLSRTTVSQHLQELRKAGLIHGETEGTRVCYCLCNTKIMKYREIFDKLFKEINIDTKCQTQ